MLKHQIFSPTLLYFPLKDYFYQFSEFYQFTALVEQTNLACINFIFVFFVPTEIRRRIAVNGGVVVIPVVLHT